METKEIQKLIDFIAQSGLDEVNIETADLKIKVKRYGSAPYGICYHNAPCGSCAILRTCTYGSGHSVSSCRTGGFQ
jgi:acetyl-CoA carboxylase biotin carboxyl carrier protein